MLSRFLSISVIAFTAVTTHASTLTTLYVDADAMSGANDGSSWTDAFTDLQTALDNADPGDEILVADGIYYPSALLATGDSVFDDSSDGRTATFELKSDVGIYGGYAGVGADNPDLRDIRAFETILSGDLGIPGDGSDNSYHVVFAHYANSNAIIDGFTITGGVADGVFPHRSGAGVYCNYGAPTVRNCVIVDNYAYHSAAGLFNRRSGSTVVNCLFLGNSVTIGGGAVENWQCFSTMTNCTFVGNMADSYAGAIYNNYCFTNITNCVIWGNTAPADPDMLDSASGSPVVTYSCIGGGHAGTGNIDVDPMLIDGIRPGGNSPCIDAGTNGAVEPGMDTDLDGRPRLLDGDEDGTITIDMGAYEYWADCNHNGVIDTVDIADGTSPDCNSNAIPDECELAAGSVHDCQGDGIIDECQIADAESTIRIEVFTDEYPDETTWMLFDLYNGYPIAEGGPYESSETLYSHDIVVPGAGCFDFVIFDDYGDGICCDYGEGYYKVYVNGRELASGGYFHDVDVVDGIGGCGASPIDCDGNMIPDECELAENDCDENGIHDACELRGNDCNSNGMLDHCEVAAGTAADCQPDGIPDDCQLGSGWSTVAVVIYTDNYPEETTWTLTHQASGEVAARGGPYDSNFSEYVKELTVPSNACFDFVIHDSAENGVCCDNGPGYYEIFVDGALIASGGDFEGSETVSNIGGCGQGPGDCDNSGVPDSCETHDDCNLNDRPDVCELAGNDCNSNSIPDDCELGETTVLLGKTLASLQTGSAAIAALVPGRYDFEDGQWGDDIWTGGYYMYDNNQGGGNKLSTNVGGDIYYTNAGIEPGDEYFGSGSTYFTAKYDGLFVMAATDISIESFHISGYTGTDSEDSVEGMTFAVTGGGRAYTAFAKRAYGGETPSVNHIIMIPGDGTGITHEWSEDPANDSHELSGLGGVSEIYYVLASSWAGGYVDDDAMVAIAEEFLDNLAVDTNDCNDNGILDECDVASGASPDCNVNGVPDECEAGGLRDCNTNGSPDLCDIYMAASTDCNGNSVADECEAGGQEDCNSNGVSDLCDIASSFSSDCNENAIADECEMEYSEDCNANGVLDVCDIFGSTSQDCNANKMPDDCESMPTGWLYVDDSATNGLKDGSSWGNAYTNLQAAMNHAVCDDEITALWVAAGTYTPDSDGLRLPYTATFNLVSGLAIYGGFAGDETSLDQRDISSNGTVLSGYLPDDQGRCLHVVAADGVDGSAVLDGIVIAGGYAHGDYWLDYGEEGGGMLILDAAPSLLNCRFSNNFAGRYGGAVYNDGGSPTFVNCIFVGNSQSSGHANAVYTRYGNSIFTNCTFTGNSNHYNATHGGVVMICEASSPTITNCIFWGNEHHQEDGPIEVRPVDYDEIHGGDDKRAVEEDGRPRRSLHEHRQHLMLERADEKGLIWPVITYSCIEGGYPGDGNIDADPMFLINPDDGGDGWTDYPYSPQDEGANDYYGDLRLDAYSPCINMGSNYATVLPALDFASNSRIIACRVDMGAYEATTIPGEFEDCNSNGIPDSCDVYESTSADCNANSIPDECEPGGTEDCNTNGVADLCDIDGATSTDCNYNRIPDDCELLATGIIYVDQSAPKGLGDGSSWDDAFRDLSTALDYAGCSSAVKEIWVAAGVYTPLGEVPVKGLNSLQDATFNLPAGVAIYGGFAGYEKELTQRDIDSNGTILSGDLFGDDFGEPEKVVGGTFTDDNCYHVLTLEEGVTGVRLDGFTVTGGNAVDEWWMVGDSGGGMLNFGGQITVANCLFKSNYAHAAGGGMFNWPESDVTIIDTVFSENATGECEPDSYCDEAEGGAISVWQGKLTVSGCTFEDNYAAWDGGAVVVMETDATIINSKFVGNHAGNLADDPDDGAEGGGAAIAVWGPSLRVANCIFIENVAAWGGAILSDSSDLVMTNCTFTGNYAEDGGAVLHEYGFGYWDKATGMESLRASNCIFWGNWADYAGPQILQHDYSEEDKLIGDADSMVTNSCIEGGYPGLGNIGYDPRFVLPFPTRIFALLEPAKKAELYDVHLAPGSPCIDRGDNTAVWSGIVTDLDGNNRIMQGHFGKASTVDMGAYEYFPDCDQDGVLDDPAQYPVGRLYVDQATSNGINDGSSWENACPRLCEAMAVAECTGTIDEIWVAGGAYTPDCDPMMEPSMATFSISNDVAIYGGFSGVETMLEERDPLVNETTLFGMYSVETNAASDSKGGPWEPSVQHVVTVNDGCTDGLLDGFTITGGYTVSPINVFGSYGGGGLISYGSGITVKSCVFVENRADLGGGAVFALDGQVSLEDCSLFYNLAFFNGGAVFAENADLTLSECRLVYNFSVIGGGGAYCGLNSTLSAVNCILAGNMVEEMPKWLEGNERVEMMAGLSFDRGGDLWPDQVYWPVAPPIGGAIANINDSTASILNCTFAMNQALGGNAVATFNYDGPGTTSTAYVGNSILFDQPFGPKAKPSAELKGGPFEVYDDGGDDVTVEYSLVWGGYPGDGNIGEYEHPLFRCNLLAFLASKQGEATRGVGEYMDELEYCFSLSPYSPCIDMGSDALVPVSIETDGAGDPRFKDGNLDEVVVVDMGVYEYQADCNTNGVFDGDDLLSGAEVDCNTNNVPDSCDIEYGWSTDCDGNGVADDCELAGNDCNDNGNHDACDILYNTSYDCNTTGIPDECELAAGSSQDCNGNMVPDECDIATHSSTDCDENGVPDECEIAGNDCNNNGVLDICDIAGGLVDDCNTNGLPDECEWMDCNNNGELDECDIASGSSDDCNDNGVPDWCDLTYNSAIFDCDANFAIDSCEIAEGSAEDCNTNGTIDYCDIMYNSGLYDCNSNWQVDSCEIAAGSGEDCNGNDRLDECDLHYGSSYDCDNNNEIDSCEIAAGSAEDCNTNGWIDWCDIEYYSHVMDLNDNGLVDECEIAEGSAEDCNDNGVPDEVELTPGSTGTDCNCTGRLDECEVAEDPSIDCNSNGRPDYCEMYYGTCGSPGPKYNDCNDNDILDECETEADCNDNGVPDECEMFPASTGDCNNNGIQDYVEIYTDSAEDCNFNYWVDECEASLCNMDCNYNGIPDDCDLNWPTASGNVIPDCNNNDIPDQCELVAGTAADCNNNRVLDSCDIAANSSIDCNTNGVIDNCEIASSSTGNDCDCSGWLDECELKWGWHDDCNYNGRPDYCEMIPGTCDGDSTRYNDCNDNLVLDECDIRDDENVTDCNSNAVPDECDLIDNPAKWDCEPDGEMDACQYPDWYGSDCDNDGALDWCMINYGASEDCNENLVPDECDVVAAGDYDADGDVDLADFKSMVDNCLEGPATMKSVFPVGFCFCWEAFDFDVDHDVDLADFAEFQRIFGGSK